MWPSHQKKKKKQVPVCLGEGLEVKHLDYIISDRNTHTHTRKTFSCLHGKGAPVHTTYNRTYLPSSLLKQQCDPTPPALPLWKQWGWEGACLHRSPLHGDRRICPRSTAKHSAEIPAAFLLPIKEAQGWRNDRKREAYEISPPVHVQVLRLIDKWFTDFTDSSSRCRHLCVILWNLCLFICAVGLG